MKIFQLINALGGGGAEVFVTQLSIALSKNLDDEVYVITYAGIIDKKGEDLKNSLLQNNVKYINVGNGKGVYRYLSSLIEICRLINTVKPDVIHAHLQPSDIFLSIIKLIRHDIKIVRTLHNPRKTKFIPKSLDSTFFSFFNANVGCSSFVKENYINPHLRKKILAIENGIDIDTLREKQNARSKDEYRNLLGLPLDKEIFINIGSMYLTNGLFSKKNQNLIIESLSILQHDPSWLMVFVGDGSLKPLLEEKVNQLGLANRFIFTGLVSNPYDYILASDCCIMPSSSEGLPISLIEAVCGGLPSILSSIDAFKPFVSDSTIYLESFEPMEISNKIFEFLQNKDDFRLKGKNNAKYFTEKFDINKVADVHYKLYAKL